MPSIGLGLSPSPLDPSGNSHSGQMGNCKKKVVLFMTK